MATNVLSGIIDIKAPNLQGAANKVSQAVDKMAISFNKLGTQSSATFSKLQAQVASFGGGVSKFSSSFTAVNTSLTKFAGSSNQASNSLINLGRVVQDAPFGFLGIANNLNPLVESFQRLIGTTGSVSGAFKALGSSLMGAGGIGLAISVVSSLLVVFGDKLFGSKKKTEEHSQALQAFNADLEASKKRVEELGASLQFLSQLATINIKIAGLSEVLDLQGQFVANQGAMVDAIEEVGRAQKLVADAFSKNQDKSNEETKKALDDANANLDNAFKKERELRQKGSLLVRQIELQKVEDQREALKKQEEEYKKHLEELKRLAKGIQDLLVTPVTLKFSDFDTPTEELEKARRTVQGFFDGSIFKIKLQPEVSFSEPDIKASLNELTSQVIQLYDKTASILGTSFTDSMQAAVDAAPPLDASGLLNASQIEGLERQFKTQFEGLGAKMPPIDLSQSVYVNQQNLEKQLQNLKDTINSGLQSVINRAFTDIATSVGEEIGNIISGQDIGDSILNAMSALVTDLGKALIKYGAIKTGLDKILGPGGIAIPGGVAIALGIAAIAAGKAFKNFGGARAAGGPVSAGRTYLVGENGPEMFVPNTGGTIVPNGGSGSFSGIGGQQVLTGRLVASGKDLVAVVSLTNAQQRRLN